MEILYNERYAKIEQTEQGNVILFKVIGYITHPEFITMVEAINKIIEDYNITGILTDTTEMKVLSQENEKYNNEVLQPAWIRLGVKKNAILMPTNAFAKYNLESITKHYKKVSNESNQKGFDVKVFDQLDAAYQWILNEQEETNLS